MTTTTTTIEARLAKLEMLIRRCPECASAIRQEALGDTIQRHAAIRAIADDVERAAAFRALPHGERVRLLEQDWRANLGFVAGFDVDDRQLVIEGVPAAQRERIEIHFREVEPRVRITVARDWPKARTGEAPRTRSLPLELWTPTGEVDPNLFTALQSAVRRSGLRPGGDRASYGEHLIARMRELDLGRYLQLDGMNRIYYLGLPIDRDARPTYTVDQWRLLVSIDEELRQLCDTGIVTVEYLDQDHSREAQLDAWRLTTPSAQAIAALPVVPAAKPASKPTTRDKLRDRLRSRKQGKQA